MNFIKEYWEFSKNLYNHEYYKNYSKDTILKYIRNMDLVDYDEDSLEITEIDNGKFTAKDKDGNVITGDVDELQDNNKA